MHIMFLASAENIHTVRWVNKLTELRHNVTLVTCPDHNTDETHTGSIDPSVRVVNLPHATNRGLGYYTNARACREIAANLNPDVINAHYASGYGTLARRARLKPLALSVWGSEVFSFPDKSIVHKRLIEKNIHYADIVMSTSEVMADRVRLLLKAPNMEIPVTPFGVDIEKFTPKRRDISDSEKMKIGIIKSHKKSIYGFETLIEAAAVLDTKFQEGSLSRPFHLDLYGDGPARPYFESLVSSLRLDHCITFHGSIPNDKVPEVLQTLDIYALPSRHESFGVAAVEAMAAGLPIVSSNAPGLTEVVKNNVTGLTVPVGDSVRFADELIRLIENPTLRSELGTAGRKDVIKRFSFSENADTLVKALQSIRVRDNANEI